jgi:hypothetical protein
MASSRKRTLRRKRVGRIESRRYIWEAIHDKTEFFCDGRMAAEVLRVVTVSDATPSLLIGY